MNTIVTCDSFFISHSIMSYSFYSSRPIKDLHAFRTHVLSNLPRWAFECVAIVTPPTDPLTFGSIQNLVNSIPARQDLVSELGPEAEIYLSEGSVEHYSDCAWNPTLPVGLCVRAKLVYGTPRDHIKFETFNLVAISQKPHDLERDRFRVTLMSRLKESPYLVM